MQSMKPILAAMLITCMSTVAMAQGGAGGGAAGAGGAGGSSGGAAAAGAGESGGGGGDLNPHRLGRGADDNPSMPGANPRLGNSAAPPSDRYGGGMRTAPVRGREDPRWNGSSQRAR
jgi:hypothetical protein